MKKEEYPSINLIKRNHVKEDSITVLEDDTVHIRDFGEFRTTLGGVKIAEVRRVSTKFSGKCIWLSYEYDWVLGRDDEGSLVLMPTKKKYF